jgi:hypothetical protein
MKDLLKEAIADAKAVRETALANAKIALEEAFAPRLQSMLSAKLAEELSEEEEEDVEVEGMYGEGEEAPVEEPVEDEVTEADDFSDYDDNGAIAEEGEEMEDDLDLESIIRELEMEDNEASGIGNDDADLYEDDMSTEEPAEDEDVDINELLNSLSEEEHEEDEDVDINEIIRSLREEDEESEEEAPASEELEEAYNVIRFLKSKINEVNLLNAKLLFSGKLFRNFSLNEGQKMKVVENFDRAHSLREVKLVYSTLAEGFKMPSTKKIVKESFASKPVASTKPSRTVLSEGAELSARFQKLAGLTKK